VGTAASKASSSSSAWSAGAAAGSPAHGAHAWPPRCAGARDPSSSPPPELQLVRLAARRRPLHPPAARRPAQLAGTRTERAPPAITLPLARSGGRLSGWPCGAACLHRRARPPWRGHCGPEVRASPTGPSGAEHGRCGSMACSACYCSDAQGGARAGGGGGGCSAEGAGRSGRRSWRPVKEQGRPLRAPVRPWYSLLLRWWSLGGGGAPLGPLTSLFPPIELPTGGACPPGEHGREGGAPRRRSSALPLQRSTAGPLRGGATRPPSPRRRPLLLPTPAAAPLPPPHGAPERPRRRCGRLAWWRLPQRGHPVALPLRAPSPSAPPASRSSVGGAAEPRASVADTSSLSTCSAGGSSSGEGSSRRLSPSLLRWRWTTGTISTKLRGLFEKPGDRPIQTVHSVNPTDERGQRRGHLLGPRY
jgi:hypothetical protein